MTLNKHKKKGEEAGFTTESRVAAAEGACSLVIILVFAQPSCKHADSQAGGLVGSF